MSRHIRGREGAADNHILVEDVDLSERQVL